MLGKDSKWEAIVAQQNPLLKANSPYLDDMPGVSEQLESKTDEDIDITEYTGRPANERRPPKPKCGPSLRIQTSVPHSKLALTIFP